VLSNCEMRNSPDDEKKSCLMQTLDSPAIENVKNIRGNSKEPFSATTASGIRELQERAAQHIVRNSPPPPPFLYNNRDRGQIF
jgi:hypothetical protein